MTACLSSQGPQAEATLASHTSQNQWALHSARHPDVVNREQSRTLSNANPASSCTCIHIHVCTLPSTHVCSNTHTINTIRIYTHFKSVCACMCGCVCVHVRACVHVCACTCELTCGGLIVGGKCRNSETLFRGVLFLLSFILETKTLCRRGGLN